RGVVEEFPTRLSFIARRRKRPMTHPGHAPPPYRARPLTGSPSTRTSFWGADQSFPQDPSRPHRHRRLPPVIDPHPAVLRITRRRVPPVLLAELRQLVGLDRLPTLLGIDAEQLRRVQAKDLFLDLVGQLGVMVLLHQLGLHLQATQALDLTLRTATPDRI